ncbi:LPS export ABC transporter ATP-binding protein [Suttonella ornithocola]|uniref:Lipopolysaccharide export system ATP-binding protein LptB n=1 Tax=Suttonella ornithocola TaxID=279832 RepID=A0A380MTH2_9GAMM|nr:LPS export ABC transporter ATP-binding protein [Suttonella ornithocola]SUO95366.1 Lipopolysaccharide export system ATP-binding protein LptB [Suttonella ornithocola]
MTTGLIAQHLKKSYKKRLILKDFSLNVQEAEVVGLLGPNGAGKTTSFYMIIGLIKPDEGHIFLDQQDMTHLPIHKRARLGLSYLPQEASVFRKLSVRDNILAILELASPLKQKERSARAQHLMQELGIEHLADTLGLALSGGERRRCEIARALATEPRFILLDEPFAGVDPIAVGEIRHIITHLTDRNIGVLITDHNVRETLKSCDRAYILGNGEVIAQGSAAEIIANPQAREIYLGDDFTLS